MIADIADVAPSRSSATTVRSAGSAVATDLNTQRSFVSVPQAAHLAPLFHGTTAPLRRKQQCGARRVVLVAMIGASKNACGGDAPLWASVTCRSWSATTNGRAPEF